MTTAVDIRTRQAHGSVVEAWSAVMDDVRELKKTDRNTQQNYSFRGIDAVVNAVGPILRKHRIIVLPRLVSLEYNDVTVGQKQTRMGHAVVTVEYTAHLAGGDKLIIAEVPGEAMDVGDKAVSKAMSIAERTAYIQSLALPTDDRDPDEDSYDRATAPKAQRRQTAAPDSPPEKTDGPVTAPTTVTMRRRTTNPSNDNKVTEAQLRALHASFNAAGITDRAARLIKCEEILDTQIASSTELTKQQASRVIDALKNPEGNQ